MRRTTREPIRRPPLVTIPLLAATLVTSSALAAQAAKTAPDSGFDKATARPKVDSGEKASGGGAKPPSSRGAHRLSALELGGGLRSFSRSFQYTEDVNANLRSYRMNAAPAASLGLGWYPAAHITDGVLSNIGLMGSYEQSFAASSQVASGTAEFDTSMRAYSMGLRFRLPFGTHQVGLSGAYGRHGFTIDGNREAGAVAAAGIPVDRDYVPDVEYAYVRPGIDARFQLGRIGVGAYAGYRFVHAAGTVQSEAWFPAATANAADAGLFGSYEFLPRLHALVGVDFRRYGLDMNSRPEDLFEGRDVAGGAVDQYIAAWVGVEWRLGETSSVPR